MKFPQHADTALVLTGGGARAAYQVGVLRGIADMVPRNYSVPFPILCGTSAGAVNATSLACYASCFHLGVKKLEWVWKNFRTDQVYQSGYWQVWRHVLTRFARILQSEQASSGPSSLLNNQPLRQLLHKVYDFKRIDNNIHGGHLRAISVTASCYDDGKSVSFYQANDDIEPWFRAKRLGQRVSLNSEYLMASAAIPLVFPSVRIQRRYYGDGSVHQLAPLSPAVHLGARRILVIGVEQPKLDKPRQRQRHPRTAEIAGHLLDTIFADTLNSDVERLKRVNDTVDFLDKHKIAHPDLRHIDTMIINPSADFNAIARRHYERLPRAVRSLLRTLGVNADSDSSLMSYLLFEAEFCRELMDMGYRDARDRSHSLRQFLQLPGAHQQRSLTR
ncbi:patatin-like phospholipase family protein [Idiomarina xiamenensis]|uniref:Patatin-like phospholipase n=1 Tax=Idiomarina xiamenensis 10-D-4 TaxID=740709 RepID=K2KC92_9GAMM|nr:patatin-like phospholipase family protein [Idiomarina xiamenensis]EKE84227.1 patatin-like phospholipase [Idiomarina xiamenensis 10-D-4]